VSDNGPGIPQREQEIVTGDRTITQLDHGSGLGLWVAKWIVEDYGGELSFEADEAGTTVVLRLERASV
jgi:signal transduction histidine kinase